LNSGDVPNIYTSDEMEQIINNMRQRFPQTNTFIPTKENLFALYVGRVKKFLHLILCMSPMGESFTTRLRMFPSLVNCCTIDWFTMWPEESLQSVAANFISEMSDIGDEEVIKGIESLIPLAPLHNAAHVQGIRACLDVFGTEVPEVVVFDTAFHSTMPPKAFTYPVPYEY